MKATRQEYIDDIKALEQTLTRFLVKHGRSGVRDLEILYAVESVMESGWMEPTDQRTYEEDLADLVEQGFDIDGLVDDIQADTIFDFVREALIGAGLVTEVDE